MAGAEVRERILEHKVVLGLLESCRYGEHQLPDPEGNYIDVSAQ
jgi:hypothetical protein